MQNYLIKGIFLKNKYKPNRDKPFLALIKFLILNMLLFFKE